MAKTSAAAPSPEILQAALQGLEAQREKLEEQIAQVRAMMGRGAGRPAKAAASQHTVNGSADGRRKRVLTPDARKRIAAAQKKRWAAFRKTQG